MHQSKRLRALAVIPFMALGLSAQTGVPAATGQTVGFYQQALNHPSYDDFWKKLSVREKLDRVTDEPRAELAAI